MQVFEANMRSVVTHMVQPLERKCRDLKVLVFADLMGDPEREVEAREILVGVFGKTLSDARVSHFLRGRDQVNSMMSSWDFCMQSLHTFKFLFSRSAITDLSHSNFDDSCVEGEVRSTVQWNASLN